MLFRFVHIEEESGANEAVQELNGTTIKGRTIKVRLKTKKDSFNI